MTGLPHRALGESGIEVSTLALGSWRTYERIPREQGLAVMRAARAAGIDFLDDARYDDETGTAPIPTGYSEVVFGGLFRAAGWRRDEVVVSNKLWWEFWPEQSAAEELEASLGRMGFESVDLVYSCPSEHGPTVEQVVEDVGALIAAGKARAWGVCNWPPEDLAAADRIARETNVPPPCAAQVPYSLVLREAVESSDAAAVLDETGAAVVASFSLAGGILTGKYDQDRAAGRWAGALDDERLRPARRAVADTRRLADRLGTTPAALALAFALSNPRVATVLFGATSTAQLEENLAAAELVERLSPDQLAQLRAVGR